MLSCFDASEKEPASTTRINVSMAASRSKFTVSVLAIPACGFDPSTGSPEGGLESLTYSVRDCYQLIIRALCPLLSEARGKTGLLDVAGPNGRVGYYRRTRAGKGPAAGVRG